MVLAAVVLAAMVLAAMVLAAMILAAMVLAAMASVLKLVRRPRAAHGAGFARPLP
jgi:hypothetical protein